MIFSLKKIPHGYQTLLLVPGRGCGVLQHCSVTSGEPLTLSEPEGPPLAGGKGHPAAELARGWNWVLHESVQLCAD